jgi:hypothetical protein
MGMFSWCCKGCGHELKMDELVRMNGCKGTYDGYGGNSGGFDSYGGEVEPACWHEACYRKATQEERDDETPSRHAGNQGFGHPALAFLKGYKEEAKTEYRVVVYYKVAEERPPHHVVREGDGLVLRSRKEYVEAYENYEGEDDPGTHATDEEWASWADARREGFERATGLKDPEATCVRFASIEEARKAGDALVADIPEYDLVVLGRQGKTEGLCYERCRYRKYRRTETGIEPTDKFREVVEYEHGVPAEKRRKGVLSSLCDD